VRRPGIAGTSFRAKIPLGEQEWQRLEALAESLSAEGFSPSPGQVASVLLSIALRSVTTSVPEEVRLRSNSTAALAEELAARYDTARGFAHCDQYLPDGTVRPHQPLQVADFNLGLTEANVPLGAVVVLQTDDPGFNAWAVRVADHNSKHDVPPLPRVPVHIRELRPVQSRIVRAEAELVSTREDSQTASSAAQSLFLRIFPPTSAVGVCIRGGMEAQGFRDLICRAQAGEPDAVTPQQMSVVSEAYDPKHCQAVHDNAFA
jgi:hypothetical protein